ncbi:coatomer subunit beta [Capsaspora owczarzaki ATCC 30864]|uniref:Coatomer subunit beta' n=1 Tax=Capsaspora owczarzaki (strain ATCC 30864) TaxID=595528 RepID=A0A0D2X0Q3_CAPO3|nr:coatomer subunit beta [Capsaspora owczarzaki ATCC 30864]
MRKLSARSDRVKSVDLHPVEPWVVCSLYNGSIHIWNFETQVTVKTFEVTELPIRAVRFIPRKNWIVAGADDMAVRVFNYNTSEKVHSFEAHSDYIRSLAVHPTLPYLLTSSDDMTIKLWDWDRNWTCVQVFEGHSHYVMMVTFNPKDTNTFASASLDKTIKVWQLGSSVPNFTLEGHERGVNAVSYFEGGEKPYLVSGADDHLVKVWDYQNKSCVQTLDGHSQNVSVVCFHPELPIILSGSEDGTIRVWHANTYRLESTLNYGLERVWAIAHLRGSNAIALGYDEGTIVIKLGREEPAMSMDSSGKIIWARHSEIQQANIKAIADGAAEVEDGERIPISTKELGSCEVYPQTLSHNPNGRFVVVCGDGEYTIYTALAWRNKAFGSALEFVWSADSSEYATRESHSTIKIFRNFKERKVIKPDFSAEGIFGGALLGIRASNFIAFYDWETTDLVRRIDLVPKSVIWSDSGSLVALTTDDAFYILRFNRDAVQQHQDSKQPIPDEGIETSFDSVGDHSDVVRTGVWVGDCFLYTSAKNRVNYFIGGELVTLAHLDSPLYLLGYIAEHNRVYLCDKDLNVVSFYLSVSVLEYETAVMRQDFAAAEAILPRIPPKQRNRVAHFLEKQGFKEQALAVSDDLEHKFDLAVQLKKLNVAYEMAKHAESELKWRQLGELAFSAWDLRLAEECLFQAKDLGGLLLLFSCIGNGNSIHKLGQLAIDVGQNNIAFVCYFLTGDLEHCLDLLCSTGRLPEAAFFARTYLPSKVSSVVRLWRENLATTNKKAAESLADPMEYENLFPDLSFALTAERLMKATRLRPVPAGQYANFKDEPSRNVIEEVKQLSPEAIARLEQQLLGGSPPSQQAPQPSSQQPPEQPQPAQAAPAPAVRQESIPERISTPPLPIAEPASPERTPLAHAAPSGGLQAPGSPLPSANISSAPASPQQPRAPPASAASTAPNTPAKSALAVSSSDDLDIDLDEDVGEIGDFNDDDDLLGDE